MSIRQDILNHRTELENELRKYDNTLLGRGHVVVTPAGSVLHIETQRDERTGKRVVATDGVSIRGSMNYTLLERTDAERIAAHTFDGRGLPCRAMHIRDFLAMAIAEADAVLKVLMVDDLN